jgi:transcriptional regulator with XRE-family HTH domain
MSTASCNIQNHGKSKTEMPTDLAAIIKRLRRDLSLTQVQLANELGIAPSSVYRYEAGASNPTSEVLEKLWALASKGSLPYSNDLARALHRKTSGPYGSQQTDLAQTVSVAGLHPHERLLVVAFIKMLRTGRDETADRVIKLLLEPWMKEAERELTGAD